jgi:ribA/ribD-fused uncharacterized protein
MTPITYFSGEFQFLSNFYHAPVNLDGDTYPTVEHAYQAAKTLDNYIRLQIRDCETPGQAKRAGRKVKMRPDWNMVRLSVMADLLRQKFEDPALAKLLLDTHPHPLVEGNTWGDVFWGVCNGKGQNHMGKLLMEIRRPLVFKMEENK